MMIKEYPKEKPPLNADTDSTPDYFAGPNREMFDKYLPKATCYMEIGTDCGRSARYVCDNSDIPIICIDPWDEHWTPLKDAAKRNLWNVAKKEL